MASLGRYILRRLIQGVITLIIVTLIIFLLFKAMPGSPLDGLRTNPAIPRAVIDAVAEQYGLNDPFEVQMYKFMRNMFTFNFGESITGVTVLSIIQEALPRTLLLFGGAVTIEYALGVLVGRYIAWRRGRLVEGGVILASLFFFNMPSFWIGLILLFLFGFIWVVFPLRGFMDSPGDAFVHDHYGYLLFLQGIPFLTFLGVIIALVGVVVLALALLRRAERHWEGPSLYLRVGLGAAPVAFGGALAVVPLWSFSMFDVADVLLHAFLPMMTLVLITAAGTILLMQTSMLEVMGEDFILTARAKGLSERIVRKRHAARNAYLPIVTSIVIALGFVVGGAIILEQIFSYYGMGWYLLTSIVNQDRFLAGAILFMISLLVIMGNIVADILYGVLDPRVRI